LITFSHFGTPPITEFDNSVEKFLLVLGEPG
jgi:hypothetical protein